MAEGAGLPLLVLAWAMAMAAGVDGNSGGGGGWLAPNVGPLIAFVVVAVGDESS